ncbi:MAG: hypothetical protein C4547_09245 [Phycisphaerales bacterium]|nr:MAG: hypothetical protein C4547_09245 [Phycisphaerales bacterium]
MSQSTKRVLNVGHCDPDHGSITRMLTAAFEVEVVRAHGTEDALEHLRLRPFDLVLVNRLYDADGRPGMDLIRRIKADPQHRDLPVMLVSDFDDAQCEAAAAGAARGFGKAALVRQSTIEILAPYLRT